MRDRLISDKNYYSRFIKTKTHLIQESNSEIINGNVPEDNVSNTIHRIFFDKLECLIAKYGRGDSIKSLKEDLNVLFSDLEISWTDQAAKFKKGRPQKTLDQYWLNSYCYMVWLLSISILIGITDKQKNQITVLIESGNITDELILFLLSGLNGKKYSQQKATTYKPFKGLTKKGLQDINQQVVKAYLKTWYQNTKLLTWHNYINSVNDKEYYFGYWSFESAAVVALCSINEKTIIEHPNFPTDLLKNWLENVGNSK
ncbi:PoNe immunity protein domain-containing protein [Fulvivirga sp. M361]|uniref:PoNe immunity protein domain-containing protein n=1 Tax=Fulvivirga sp. M361 TaxID=2594266 RepID=UPI00162985C1|nr:PoNe immunity protein domain-containing protein [Fulvivirga sp. M361]